MGLFIFEVFPQLIFSTLLYKHVTVGIYNFFKNLYYACLGCYMCFIQECYNLFEETDTNNSYGCADAHFYKNIIFYLFF